MNVVGKRSSVGAALVLVATFLLLVLPGSAHATTLSHESVKDVDIVFFSSGTLALTEDGRLFATGQQYNGEFGNGEAASAYQEFTEIDISHLSSKPVDIISAPGQTFLLTEKGELYVSGAYWSGSAEYTFKQIDPALYGSKPIKQVFRTIFSVVFTTQEGKMYTFDPYEDMDTLPMVDVSLPQSAGVPITVKKAAMGEGGDALYVLSTSGHAWVCQDYYEVREGEVPQWELVVVPSLGGETISLTSMISIEALYFLSEDGRVLYSGSYTDLDGEEYEPLEPNQMDYTDIKDVAAFLPFYAPTVYSYYPNIKKTDGTIQFGRGIFEALGVSDIPAGEEMIQASLYYPASINNATVFTIGGYADPYSSGTYLLNNYLGAINGDEYAGNGVLIDPDDPPQAFTATPLLTQTLTVLEPNAPLFTGAVYGKTNPVSALLAPQQQGTTAPIQANWQIVGEAGTVVTSGTASLLNGSAVVDIKALSLPDGSYVLTWYRETAPSYTGVHVRSDETASAPFIVTSQPIKGADVTVRYTDKEGIDLVPSQVLTGVLGDPYTTAALTIEDYTLVTTPSNAEGFFTEEVQEVIYGYEYSGDNGGGGDNGDGDNDEDDQGDNNKEKGDEGEPPTSDVKKLSTVGDDRTSIAVGGMLFCVAGGVALLARRKVNKKG